MAKNVINEEALRLLKTGLLVGRGKKANFVGFSATNSRKVDLAGILLEFSELKIIAEKKPADFEEVSGQISLESVVVKLDTSLRAFTRASYRNNLLNTIKTHKTIMIFKTQAVTLRYLLFKLLHCASSLPNCIFEVLFTTIFYFF